MLANWCQGIGEEDYEEDEAVEEERAFESEIKNITAEERECLIRFIKTLNANQEKDPKYKRLLEILIDKNWIERGCIIFSQYYDSARWVAENLSNDLPDEKIGIYAGEVEEKRQEFQIVDERIFKTVQKKIKENRKRE